MTNNYREHTQRTFYRIINQPDLVLAVVAFQYRQELQRGQMLLHFPASL